jgi:hypothetical protein
MLTWEVLGDPKSILESQGIEFPDNAGLKSEEEHRSSLTSTTTAPITIEPTDQVPARG